MEWEKEEKKRAYKSWQSKSSLERVIQKSGVPHWLNDSCRPDNRSVKLGWFAVCILKQLKIREKIVFIDNISSEKKAC